MIYGLLYGLCLGCALVLDALWLGVIARSFYSRQLQHLMADNVNWWAAALFYAIHAAGILGFCVLPALREESLRYSIVSSAALGFLMYGTYDLTNHATLRQWPMAMTLVDISWGVVISVIVGLTGFIVGSKMLTT